jgi:outer membrane biosynthesis protein TonB
MDRAEATGFGVALAGHGLLFAALVFGFASTQLPEIRSDPIEVAFVDEVGLTSTSPTPSAAEPAPELSEPDAAPDAQPLPEPVPPTPVPVPPQPRVERPPPTPVAKPVPRPPVKTTQPQPKPQPNPQPQTKAQTKANPRPDRLAGLLNGVTDRASESRSEAAPAAQAGPAVQASLARAIRQQLKPHWKSPTGADVEQLRTTVRVTLSQSGAVLDIGQVTTTGQTASNRSQVRLHQEQAIRAVRLAAPFRLPTEFYGAWKEIAPVFDRRLSQ